jgi:8-amino-7-oxononanoate synthase
MTRNLFTELKNNRFDFIDEELETLEAASLKRTLKLVEGSQGTRIVIDGKDVLNFCSNNYLGLADDERLKEAAIKSLEEEGFGAGASRLISGNMSSHKKLEQTIARFKRKEKALLFSTGYMANVGVISSLFGREDWLFCDKLNHASLIDGVLLSQANFKRYAHNDMNALEDMLKNAPEKGKRCIVTDSVFSMDGDIASLEKIVALAEQYHALVMIDEAHALGVMGKTGRGLAEHFDLEDKIDIQIGTLSKAAGSFGAYCVGEARLIDYLINRARSFIYTTAMPPSVAAASVAAIKIMDSQPDLLKKLWDNTVYIREGLQQLGFDTLHSVTPIIPILIKDSAKALMFSQELFDRGIFVSAVRPPTVPLNTARLRLTVMATHTKDDLNVCLKNFQEIGQKLCLI